MRPKTLTWVLGVKCVDVGRGEGTDELGSREWNPDWKRHWDQWKDFEWIGGSLQVQFPFSGARMLLFKMFHLCTYWKHSKIHQSTFHPYACVCVWAQGHVCEWGGASSWEWMWVSHSIGNTPIWLEWLPRKLHGSAYHLLPSSGIIGVPLHLAFTWVLRVDLRSLYLDSKHDCLNCAVNPQQNNLE